MTVRFVDLSLLVHRTKFRIGLRKMVCYNRIICLPSPGTTHPAVLFIWCAMVFSLFIASLMSWSLCSMVSNLVMKIMIDGAFVWLSLLFKINRLFNFKSLIEIIDQELSNLRLYHLIILLLSIPLLPVHYWRLFHIYVKLSILAPWDLKYLLFRFA